MREPTRSELQSVVEPNRSTNRAIRAGAHECFRGVRLLLGALLVSIAVWVGLAWGFQALIGAF